MRSHTFPFMFTRQSGFFLAGVVVVMFASWSIFLGMPAPSVEVNFMDVGQADAILIQSSEGKVVLIDGGYPDSRAMRYLTSRGITRIDLLILTHGHDDHVGGLAEILRTLPVDRVVTHGYPFESPAYDYFLAALAESGAQHEVVRAGEKLRVGSLVFQVLSPASINPDSENNNSVVTRLTVGDVSFLFTGDAQELAESWMVQSGYPLQASILKVPHHAADTSSSPAFIVAVHPAYAIYMAEVGNIHGFPHQKTLDTLTQAGAQILGTDTLGTITVTTDGETYAITSEKGGPVISQARP